MSRREEDIEEMEIEVEPQMFYNDDSNSSEPPTTTSRKLRRRPAATAASSSFTSASPSSDNGRKGNLVKSKRILDKDTSEFLGKFDQVTSEREKRKLNKKSYKEGRVKSKATVFDERGILMSCKKDLCDCMDDTCPGCHFPCPKCRSVKCGHECRQNRKWIFDCLELDGVPGSLRENPYAKEFQVPRK